MTVDDFYDKYLQSKLDLIFNENGQTISDISMFIPQKSEKIKKYYSQEIEPTYCTYTSTEKALDMFPLLKPYLDSEASAIYLPNGIYGIDKRNYKNQITHHELFFPELNLYYEGIDADVKMFPNGFFVIGKYLFNSERKLINVNSKDREVDYTMIPPNYIRVEYKDGDKNTYNLIDSNGNLFDHNKDYYDIYSNGEIIYIQINDPLEEYALNDRKQYKILMNNGEFLDDGRIFDEVNVTQKGNFIAKIDNSSYLYRKDGKLLTKDGCLEIHEFNEYKNPLYWIKEPLNREKVMDENEVVFAKRDFNNIEMLSEDYAIVQDDRDQKLYDQNGSKIKIKTNNCHNMIINKDGIILHDNKEKNYNDVYVNYNCITFDNKGLIVEKKGKLKDYSITKTLLGYKCKSNDGTFTIKYQPLIKYSDTFILCIDKENNLKMYNRKTGQYQEIDNINYVKFNESFICLKNHIIYPYKDQLIDVDNYFKNKLSSNNEVKINDDVGEILTKEEFIDKYKDKLNLTEKIIEEDNSKIIEEQNKRMQTKKEYLERKKQEEELERRQKIKERYLCQLKEIADGLEAIGELPTMSRLKINNLYETVEDHLEIRKEYKPFLKVIDLQGETFKNVNISGLNFTGTNISGLNPQIVYKKDLSNCDFTNIFIPPFTIFTGVKLNGTKLSYDKDPRTIDSLNESIKYAEYDENTRINNKTVEEFFKEEENIKTANI